MYGTQIIALLTAASTVAALPQRPGIGERPADKIYPWQISTLYTHSPSGRPGNDPHSTLNFTINDYSTIVIGGTPTGWAVWGPSTANCSAQWLTSADVPYDTPINCSETLNSQWSFKLLPGTGEAGYGATTDFNLEITLKDELYLFGTTYTKIFKGTDLFKVGENLAGQCGGSGVCNWGLQNTPYNITQGQ
ncbi:hypothetical protein B0J11DRAFT_582166 [Dendryphion nanum]|uniref:Uncharacterized protein n=1 Tax=Dendryphion nanum TaxID=256645 RepID=A0A9P9DIK9_9PLEO|nr:hypothetical protein B0J11DRAFT_582166 [Dendryphion nanum]